MPRSTTELKYLQVLVHLKKKECLTKHLRMVRVDNEDYGRGYVEEVQGRPQER